MDKTFARQPGNEPRARVIALHSSAASGRQWNALADRLRDVEFVAPDLYGHGDGHGHGDVPRDVLADDVERVAAIVCERPEGAHVVGHSYGGAVAIALARAHPGRVRSLTVFEPVLFGALFRAEPRRSAFVREFGERIVRLAELGDLEAAAASFVDFWSGPGSWDAIPTRRRASVVRRMPAVAGHFRSLAASPIRFADLARLPTPMLHLSGAASLPVMRLLETRLREALPWAGYGTMTAIGHMGPISHPHTIAQRIERHLRSRFAEDRNVAMARAA